MKPFWIHKADNGYTFDRRIFWGVMFIWLLLIVVNGFYFNWDFNYHPNIQCDRPEGCKNPLLEEGVVISDQVVCKDMWCEEKYLQGFNGTPLPWFYTDFTLICIVTLFLGFVINHRIWNKGKMIGFRPTVPDKVWEAMKKVAMEGETEDVEDNDKGKNREWEESN